ALRYPLPREARLRLSDSIRRVSNALALVPLVRECVAFAFPDRFPFPLAHRGHDVDDQSARGRTGVQRLGNRDQSNAAPLESLQQLAQVFDATIRRVNTPTGDWNSEIRNHLDDSFRSV